MDSGFIDKEGARRRYFSLSKAIQRSECEETKEMLRSKRSFFRRIWRAKPN